jgi:3-phosphoshikimate 1-carboxyvinyltransferase
MSLPGLIEIVPLDKPVRAEITVPGSKSITNRALILAALGEAETTLQGALWSEDTQVMLEALRALGFQVKVEPDPREFCNRFITVKGLGGAVPIAGTDEKPLELFVGNAGTAARFLSALVCLGRGVYRLRGVGRMHERPQAALFEALRALGYSIDAPNNRLPATIRGTGPRPGKCRVSIEESSQFASALLLCARVGGWQVEVVGENAEESPYVAMSTDLVEKIPAAGGVFRIEADASSGSYFWAVGALEADRVRMASRFELPVSVSRWPELTRQVDAAFPRYMPLRGVQSPKSISRRLHLGDSIMTAIVLAPFVEQGTLFTDLGRLRVQECERVFALRAELTRCGATVIERGDTLQVFPSKLHGAEIETYDDHRMAMCFAILGLKVSGIKIKNPACVKKTFPNFFQKLAAPLPGGLGVSIRNAETGSDLGFDNLFAE